MDVYGGSCDLCSSTHRRRPNELLMGDLLRAWAAVVPVGELIIFAILLIALFACAAYATLTSSRWGMDELIAIPLLGLMAAYSIALLAAKRRMSAGPWS
jgi:hypothetical protein